MENWIAVAIGVVIYLVLLVGLMLFGRFLHECDEEIKRQFKGMR